MIIIIIRRRYRCNTGGWTAASGSRMIGSQQYQGFERGIEGLGHFKQYSAGISRDGAGLPELMLPGMAQAPIIPAPGVTLCLALLWSPFWLLLMGVEGLHTGLFKAKDKLSIVHTLSQFFLGELAIALLFKRRQAGFWVGLESGHSPQIAPSQLGNIAACWGQCLFCLADKPETRPAQRKEKPRNP